MTLTIDDINRLTRRELHALLRSCGHLPCFSPTILGYINTKLRGER